MNRRNFLELTASSTTALLLTSLETIASQNTPVTNVKKNLTLKIMATNWGFNGTMKEFITKVKKDGYDGIEIVWPRDQKDQEEMFALLKGNGLEAAFLCRGDESTYKENYNTFKEVTSAAATNKYQKPLYINCHSGKDYFSFEENETFIAHTSELEKQTGVPMYHETHRSRMLFAAPVAKQYLQKHPELKVTFDVSHWCNVSESLLEDQPETVALTLERTGHIHARIGHPEGPQVNDPRAPEWEGAVKAHLAWWDKVAERKKQNGETMTILTEFGPPTYMPTLPYTLQPLTDQWAVNVYMMELLRKRYV